MKNHLQHSKRTAGARFPLRKIIYDTIKLPSLHIFVDKNRLRHHKNTVAARFPLRKIIYSTGKDRWRTFSFEKGHLRHHKITVAAHFLSTNIVYSTKKSTVGANHIYIAVNGRQSHILLVKIIFVSP